MLDYSDEQKNKCCPKVDCHRKDECCDCGLTYTQVPAALGDDSEGSEYAPQNGLYTNKIVEYEANGHIYVYGSDGIPVFITRQNDVILYSETGSHTDGAMTQLATTQAINGLSQDITTEEGARQNADNNLQSQIDGLSDIAGEHVFGFDTVADMGNSANLIVGSFAKTYGLYRKGDGVYDIYIVREKLDTDTVDGYNVVALNETDDLIAERMQIGKKVVIELEPTDDIQDYLDLKCDKTIVLPSNTTYEVTSKLYINSDTTIELNNSTLFCNYDSDETIAFAYRPTDTFAEYNGYKNIVIKNGTWKGGCIALMHNKHVDISNVEFELINSRHALQIAACYDVNIENCIFNGTLSVNLEGSECINIDPCIYDAQPYISSSSVMFDHTPNMFIKIKNNIFKATNESGYRYTNAIGSHSGDANAQSIAKEVLIENNDFGSPYSHTINVCDYVDTKIINNTVTYDLTNMYDGDTVRFIYLRRGYSKLNIENNNIINADLLFYTLEGNTLTKEYLTITNNVFKGRDDSDSGVIWVRNTSQIDISDNYIETTVASILLDCNRIDEIPVEGTESHDAVIHNNTFVNTTSNTSGLIKIRGNSYNIDVTNNIFEKYDNNSFALRLISFTGDASLIKVINNTCNFMTHFTYNAGVSKNMYNNNCLVDLTGSISELSTTITLSMAASNFHGLIILVGDADENCQRLEIYPYHVNDDYIETTDRAWKQVVSSTADSISAATISTSDNATKLTYNSTNVPIRKVYGMI